MMGNVVGPIVVLLFAVVCAGCSHTLQDPGPALLLECKRIDENVSSYGPSDFTIELDIINNTTHDWAFQLASSRMAEVASKILVGGRWMTLNNMHHAEGPPWNKSGVVKAGEKKKQWVLLSLAVVSATPLRHAMNGGRCRFAVRLHRVDMESIAHTVFALSTRVTTGEHQHDADSYESKPSSYPILKCTEVTQDLSELGSHALEASLVLTNDTHCDWLWCLGRGASIISTEVLIEGRWRTLRNDYHRLPVAGLVVLKAGKKKTLTHFLMVEGSLAPIIEAMNNGRCRFSLWLHLAGENEIEHTAVALSTKVTQPSPPADSRPK